MKNKPMDKKCKKPGKKYSEYEQDFITDTECKSAREFAQKHGLSERYFLNMASERGWVVKKEKYKKQIAERTIEKLGARATQDRVNAVERFEKFADMVSSYQMMAMTEWVREARQLRQKLPSMKRDDQVNAIKRIEALETRIDNSNMIREVREIYKIWINIQGTATDRSVTELPMSFDQVQFVKNILNAKFKELNEPE